MLKVLIVDDNTLIRKSIRKRIQWDALDMECVGEAGNGIEAQHIIDQLLPDIIITDIKMPHADGFFAIRETKERYPGLQFIVISGYDDFSYLKQAVQLQVLNYILKPIDTGELNDSLRKAAEAAKKYHASCTMAAQAHNYKTLYDREKLELIFLKLLFSKTEFQIFADSVQQIAPSFFQPYAQCIIFNIPETSNSLALSREHLFQLEQSMDSLCFPANSLALSLSRETYAIILAQNNAASFSKHQIQQIYDTIREILPQRDTPLFLSYSNTVPLNQLSYIYDQSLGRLIQRFMPEVPVQTILFIVPKAAVTSTDPLQFQNELTVAFELKLYDECKSMIHDIVKKSARSFDLYLLSLQRMLDILNACLIAAQHPPLYTSHLRELYILSFASRDQLIDTLCATLDQLPAAPADIDVADCAIRYIQEHYTTPLTLKLLSELFHVNQIYLGQRIKKKTNLSFNNLLNQLRIKHAVSSIQQNPDISFKNLAFSLGYTDSNYFTKVFKQYYGCTPTEYRANLL